MDWDEKVVRMLIRSNANGTSEVVDIAALTGVINLDDNGDDDREALLLRSFRRLDGEVD